MRAVFECALRNVACAAALAVPLGCSTSQPPPAPGSTSAGASSGGSSGTAAGGAAGSAFGSGGTSGAGQSAGTSGGGAAGSSGGTTTGPAVGAATFADGELDPPSQGATITMQSIGAPGWYPSRRDPASGQCDAINTDSCCMTEHQLTDDKLSPWNEELIMTLRGPMLVKQFVAYEPDSAAPNTWKVASAWDERSPQTAAGIHFDGNGAEATGFPGVVGSECLVDVMKDAPYPCGPGSQPYCPAEGTKYYGWSGSKLFVLLAAMPHIDSPKYASGTHCEGVGDGWLDAPWIGLSHGELVRSGKFGGCHCYAKDPAQWQLADGCGQFNVFEVVNDENPFKNLDLFSTNLFAYHGYVGEGPCGEQCDISALGSDVDLVNKATSGPATQGAITTPTMGPGAAFRRPASGYRYFVILLDVDTRTIQLALVHPQAVPPSISELLPALPLQVGRPTIDALVGLRLPQ